MSLKKSIIRKIDTRKLCAIAGVLVVLVFGLLVAFFMGALLLFGIFIHNGICIHNEMVPDSALAILVLIGISAFMFWDITEAISNEISRRATTQES